MTNQGIMLWDESYKWFYSTRESSRLNQVIQNLLNQTRHYKTRKEETDLEMAIRILEETDPNRRWTHG